MPGYQPKTFREQGGDRFVVANGGSIVVESGGTINVLAPNGAIYFVDANVSASGDGLSWGDAFLTMAEAFAVLGSGDTILFRGKIREQLTTPVGVFDVTIRGAGNRPRHADVALAGDGNGAANTWTIPASGSTDDPLLTILHQGWRLENILFAGHSTDACVRLERTGTPDTADERDASHAQIIGCRFASGQDGIEIVEVSNVLIQGNQFHDLTGFAIKGVAGSGIANPLRGRVLDNIFTGCANGFKCTCSQWVISRNFFDDGGTPTTTVVCDTAGDGVGAANNFVTDNFFQVATANFNSPDIVGTATDVWNNTSIDGTASMIGREVGQPA